MNLKEFAYHYTSSNKVKSIQENGLIPSGGLHVTGVYMTLNPKQYLGWKQKNRTAIFGIHLRGLEKNLLKFSEKKWIISTKKIPKENIFYIGENFENKTSFNEALKSSKEKFSLNNPRVNYGINANKIKELILNK